MDISFNPCFGGSYIVTISKVTLKQQNQIRFNPCFGGSYIVTVRHERKARGRIKFQSLFWWILYCDCCHFYLFLRLHLSFNPCFGGSYIVTKHP